MAKIVKFDDESMTGKVSENAFFKGLPEGLTKETFKAVDDFRESKLCQMMDETMDFAEKSGVGSGEGNGVQVLDIPMGGHAKADIVIDPCFNVTSQVSYAQSELMEAVLARSASLFDQHNNVPAEEEAEA